MKRQARLVIFVAMLCAHGAIAENKKVEKTHRTFSGGSPMANARAVDQKEKPDMMDLRAQPSIEEAQSEVTPKEGKERKRVRRSFSGGSGLANARVVSKERAK